MGKISKSSKLQMSELKKEYLLKVIVIGDSGVGKTNLITRFSENAFKDTYVATIGVDFKVKSLPIKDKKIKMQIWDTAGQERFKNITQTYYRGASGIILAYSTTDQTSFSNIERWMTQIESNAPENVSKILVATKQDLQRDRAVQAQCGKQLASKYGIPFIQVSAKSGFQVKNAFELLAEEMDRKQIEDSSSFKAGLLKEKGEVLKNTGDSRRNCSC